LLTTQTKYNMFICIEFLWHSLVSGFTNRLLSNW
jgi:hypothetical protein